jgi:hypothetical protein
MTKRMGTVSESRRAFLSMVVAGSGVCFGQGNSNKSSNALGYVDANRISPMLKRYLAAHGNRLTAAGQERVNQSGSMAKHQRGCNGHASFPRS